MDTAPGLEGVYIYRTPLGRGAYGTVYPTWYDDGTYDEGFDPNTIDPTTTPVAVSKIINVSNLPADHRENAVREMHVLARALIAYRA